MEENTIEDGDQMESQSILLNPKDFRGATNHSRAWRDPCGAA